VPREPSVNLVTLPGVEIIATGTWALSSGETTFTADDLENALDAARCPSVGDPIIKIGHVDPRFDGEPAVGRVANMKLTAGGNKITADLTGMPNWLGEAAASAYPNRSIEGSRDFRCQQGHLHPFVITALALLGVTRPGVGVLSGIEDVAALYDVAAASGTAGETWRVVMGAAALPRKPRISAKVTAAIAAAHRRGAISANRTDEWVSWAAGVDEDEAVAIIRAAWGPNGGTGRDGDDEDEAIASLWPPATGAESERRRQLAISASRPWSDDELYDAIFGREAGR
jgi:hypothetical protein